jgi:hypothetical protein
MRLQGLLENWDSSNQKFFHEHEQLLNRTYYYQIQNLVFDGTIASLALNPGLVN